MVKIIADSTCDLPENLVEKYRITIVPLYVRLGEKEFKDGIDISPADLFKWSDEHGATPKTAAPGIADYSRLLDPDSDDQYVIFTIASDMSASFNNARLSADRMNISERVHIIDSRNLSAGIGLQVILAAEMASMGKSAKEICDAVRNVIPRVRSSFVIDTLVYLHRGGRCSSVSALLGTALKLHPRIAVSDGAMRLEKKYRGAASKYILDYVKDMRSDLLKAEKARVMIVHSGCKKEIVDKVKEYLEGLDHFDQILESRAGSVVSSHCGPGTLV